MLAAAGARGQAERPRGLAVLPPNRETVRTWLAVQTQWRRAGDSGMPTGLDYPAVESALRLAGVARRAWPRVFGGLRVMEAEALPRLQRQIRDAQARARRTAGRR